MNRGEAILTEVRFLTKEADYTRFTEINRAYREILRRTKFTWLRVSDEQMLTFKTNQETYLLNTEKIRVLTRIWVRQSDGSQRWKLLEEAPPQLFESKVWGARDSDGSDDLARPKFYKLESGPTVELTVSPIPDQDYSAKVDYIEHVSEITAGSVPRLPPAYDDTVSLLAAGYILESSADAGKAGYGQTLIGRAEGLIESLVSDSAPNRTIDIDRVEQPWMR